ncbi:DUF4913 domain-containing protein [Raineyella fluvialis]|uniref:DUF4913 domain-containing protein n=1 Tax=Raineyella fluvialis TaxID=2662261 RepID=A0A5Q2FEH6_9ACTN|nr:DUF4913 domain-containing protein [Raineyella fluvialis]QGF23125.1 DUF4913 domain-containing protein [Raineyella fluvialis]
MSDPTSQETTSEKATSQDAAANEMTQSPLQAAEEALRAARAALDDAVANGSSADVLTAQDVVDRAQAQVDALRTGAIEADNAAYSATVADDLEQATADEHPMLYSNSADWLVGYMLPMWRRGPEARWCTKWWLHAEAYTRIEALWRTWEALRYEGPHGIATWLLTYADPLMRELTTPTGPVRKCHPLTGEHDQLPAWTAEPPPPASSTERRHKMDLGLITSGVGRDALMWAFKTRAQLLRAQLNEWDDLDQAVERVTDIERRTGVKLPAAKAGLRDEAARKLAHRLVWNDWIAGRHAIWRWVEGILLAVGGLSFLVGVFLLSLPHPARGFLALVGTVIMAAPSGCTGWWERRRS